MSNTDRSAKRRCRAFRRKSLISWRRGRDYSALRASPPSGAALRALTRGEYLERLATTRDGVTLVGCPSPPGVIPPRRGSIYRDDLERRIACCDRRFRRGWDSNSTVPLRGRRFFKTGAFNRSATSPQIANSMT